MENEVILKLILDKLDSLDSKINTIDTRLVTIDARLDKLEHRFDGLENKLNGMEKRLDAVFEQTALLTEFKAETEAALAEINKTIESKYDLILRDIECVAGEQGKQRIDIARLQAAVGER